MKKLLIFPLSLLIILCSFHIGTFATIAPAIYIEDQDVSIAAEEEFSLNVSISGNPGIISLRFKVIYDDTVLELLSVEDAKLLNGFTTPPSTISSPYTLRWANSLATENNTQIGKIVTLKFRAIQAKTKTTVSLELTESRNANGQKINFKTDAAEITVNAKKCDHSFTNYIPDIIANCHTEGTEIAYCDHGCGEMSITVIGFDSTAHEGATEIRNASVATCTENGYTGDKFCISCNTLKESGSVIPASGHTWDEGTLISESTCLKEGSISYTCIVCSETTKKILPRLEHSWVEISATTKKCSLCGGIKTQHPPVSGGDITLGDLDEDGNITAADARSALRAAVGLDTLTEMQMIAADVNHDTKITSADARTILRTAVGLETIQK